MHEGRRQEEDSNFNDYPCPITISNLTQYEEMRQFYTINKMQMGVRTDLAQRFLVREANETGEAVMLGKGKINELNIVNTIKIVEDINDRKDSPWHKRIQFPNEDREKQHITKQLSFVDSFTKTGLIQDVTFARLIGKGEAVKVIIEYWEAIKELMPEAFEDPDNYVIQKTSGIFTMHWLLPTVLDLCREKGKINKEEMKKILSNLKEEMQSGYWEKTEGPGAMYGSMKGFKLHADKLKFKLNSVVK